ncbi:MAG: fimbrillin family protein [Rikenellaceae bacterium]
MKKYLTLSLCSLLLWSCAKDSETINTSADSRSVTFTSEITTRVSSTGFDYSDAISVAAYSGTTALYANTLYTYNGMVFTSSDPIIYETDDQELSFLAVYPAQEGSITNFDFEIATDQRSDDSYELSDLLTSSISATRSTTRTVVLSPYVKHRC